MAKIFLPCLSRTDTPMFEFLRTLQTDVPILLISRMEEFTFNEEVYELKGKQFVVVDVIEMGWNVEIKETMIVGQNTFDFNFVKDTDNGWLQLHNFLASHKPSFYFKRELLKKDQTPTLLPIEYPNFQSEYPAQTKEEFESRPISIFNYWGRSHEARLITHGELWKHAARKGYAMCDNIYYFNNFMSEESNPRKIVGMNFSIFYTFEYHDHHIYNTLDNFHPHTFELFCTKYYIL